jgi:carbon-monoxide dehydrogenase large subunit
MSATPYVGRSMKRLEDPRLITGVASYVDDLHPPGLLHAAFLRSPYAHARIGRINVEAARKMPGVVGVFTGADVNAKCGNVPCASDIPGLKAPAHTVLAGERAYFVGHAVAVVIARDRYTAVDALDAIEVEYEPLPAVTDPERALEPGSPLTHPDLGTNVAFTWSLTTSSDETEIERLFAQADRVIKQRIVHQRLTPMAMEPRGLVAQWSRGDQALTLWTSTQIPHLVRTLLPGMISVPENRIRIVAPEVGGGFGSKLNLYIEEALCSYLAIKLNAPIKWIESRRENAQSTIHGRDQIASYEVAVKNDGRILAVKTKAISDLGSYLQLLTPAIPTLTGLMLSGCYKIQQVRMDVTGVYTNKMSTDAYRGAGRPEATYAIERMMDIVSNHLAKDAIELRIANFPKKSEFPFTTACGLTYDSGDYEAALKKAKQLVKWNDLLRQRGDARKAGKLFGVGVSTYVEICALGPSKAMAAGGWEWGCVRVEFSGKVTVITGATPHGQGQETSFAQLVADRLGVPIEDIVVLRGDTNVAHYGRDTYGSRATVLGGTAIIMCVDKILAKTRLLAAHLLETTPDKLTFANGQFSYGDKSLGWSALAPSAYVAKNIPPGFEPGLEASHFFEPENFTFPFGTHIVAVEVDRQTGEVKIVKYVAVDDCGPQINPLLVEGQVQGGIAHSIGQVLFEQTVYDESGQLITGEFMDYPLPRAEDVPQYILGATETPSPSNPLGIKGVGEAGTIGATPAIANAVLDALYPLGIRHLDLPLTPEKIWRAIEMGAQDDVKELTPAVLAQQAEARYSSDQVGEGALEVGNV